MPKFLTVISGIAASVVLVVFFVIVIAAVLSAGKPPLVGDVAPSQAPQLLCPQSTPGAAPTSPSGSASGSPSTPTTPTGGATPAIEVTCGPAAVAYAPQYRSAFDESARLLALLAVVAPLVTTVVGFYFGQKAGEGSGQADAAATKTAAVGAINDAAQIDPSDTAAQTKKQALIDKVMNARRQ